MEGIDLLIFEAEYIYNMYNVQRKDPTFENQSALKIH